MIQRCANEHDEHGRQHRHQRRAHQDVPGRQRVRRRQQLAQADTAVAIALSVVIKSGQRY